MGRARGTKRSASPAPGRGATPENADAALRDTDHLPLRAIRREYLPKEEHRTRDREYLAEIKEALDDSLFLIASSPESWKGMLWLYGQAPDHSIRNVLAVRETFRRRGIDPNGRFMTAQKWEKLGRRIKAEYTGPWGKGKTEGTPSGDNGRNYGYDPDREWSEEYIAEIIVPTSGNKSYDPQEERDPATGEIIETIKETPHCFRVMRVYHENATEALDGSNPEPLSDADVPRGNPSEALVALTDALEGLGYEFEIEKDMPHAARARVGKTVVLDSQSPKEQQALALAEILADAHLAPPRTEEDALIRDTLRASVAYAVCAAYGIDPKQEFPDLEEIAENPRALSQLVSQITRLTEKMLKLIDRRLLVKP